MYDTSVTYPSLEPWAKMIGNSLLSSQKEEIIRKMREAPDSEVQTHWVILNFMPVKLVRIVKRGGMSLEFTEVDQPHDFISSPIESPELTRERYGYGKYLAKQGTSNFIGRTMMSEDEYTNLFRYVFKKVQDAVERYGFYGGDIRIFKDGNKENTENNNIRLVHTADAVTYFVRRDGYEGFLDVFEDFRSDQAVSEFITDNLDTLWYFFAIAENKSFMPVMIPPPEDSMPDARGWFDDTFFYFLNREIKFNMSNLVFTIAPH